MAKQSTLGLPVVTDGELRRRNFQESFGLSVAGFDQAAEDKSMANVTTSPMARAEQDFSAAGPAIITRRKVVERLRLVRNVPLDEYRITSKLTKTPVKVSVLSPDRISQRFDWEHSTAVYPDMDAFLADVVEITRQMIRSLSRPAVPTFRSTLRVIRRMRTRCRSSECVLAARTQTAISNDQLLQIMR